MKKQSSSAAAGRKLSLNKKTISNLKAATMKDLVGGGTVRYYGCGHQHTKNCTQNQNTCPGHNTCYTC